MSECCEWMIQKQANLINAALTLRTILLKGNSVANIMLRMQVWTMMEKSNVQRSVVLSRVNFYALCAFVYLHKCK